MTHLVTGYAGYEHIQSEDDGAFNAAFFGGSQYVMAFGNQFEGSIVDNNTVRILDGDGLMYGRHFRIKPNTYEDVTITTGTAGTNRIDLIVMTYEKNENDGTEKAHLQVIKGEESENSASVPEHTDGNILEGATFNQMPLYKVTISGVVLQDIEPLFEVIKTYKQLAEESAAEFKEACETHLNSLAVLDTMEEIEANTQEKQIAGALALKELEVTLGKSVSDGKTLVATAITEEGVSTATDAEYATMADNVHAVADNHYASGFANADARVNTASASYSSGYSAGVTAADNRANANSVNYQTGYNNGYNAARANISAVDSNAYQNVHYSETAYVAENFKASRTGVCTVSIAGNHGHNAQNAHGLSYQVTRNGVAMSPFQVATSSYQQTAGFAFGVTKGDTIAISASYANVGGDTQTVNVVRTIVGVN